MASRDGPSLNCSFWDLCLVDLGGRGSLAIGLSILWNFSENQLWCHWFFPVSSCMHISLLSVLVFIGSFLQLSMNLILHPHWSQYFSKGEAAPENNLSHFQIQHSNPFNDIEPRELFSFPLSFSGNLILRTNTTTLHFFFPFLPATLCKSKESLRSGSSKSAFY